MLQKCVCVCNKTHGHRVHLVTSCISCTTTAESVHKHLLCHLEACVQLWLTSVWHRYKLQLGSHSRLSLDLAVDCSGGWRVSLSGYHIMRSTLYMHHVQPSTYWQGSKIEQYCHFQSSQSLAFFTTKTPFTLCVSRQTRTCYAPERGVSEIPHCDISTQAECMWTSVILGYLNLGGIRSQNQSVKQAYYLTLVHATQWQCMTYSAIKVFPNAHLKVCQTIGAWSIVKGCVL